MQNVVVGAEILEKTAMQLKVVSEKVVEYQSSVERLRNEVDSAEVQLRKQNKAVRESVLDLDLGLDKEKEMQLKIESFWKNDPRVCLHYAIV